MLPETGPAGGEHGFDPLTQIWPIAVLPFATPFTNQVTVVSALPATFAANDWRWLTVTVALLGATFTAMLLANVTLADATVAPAVA